MDPQHALTARDDDVRAHVATLSDEQLLDFLAAIDAAEVVAKSADIDLGASALFYAQRIGWPVFPLVPHDKKPVIARAHRDDAEQAACRRACGRDGHGLYDATRDPDRIRAWWRRWPEANIGVPTGADGCGYDVIDIDGRPGIASLALLKHAECPADCSAETFCAASGEIPSVACRAMTPGDAGGPGFHYFIDPTGDGNGTSIAPGIDYRGAGGYVCVPPSLGPHGVRYAWITRPELAA